MSQGRIYLKRLFFGRFLAWALLGLSLSRFSATLGFRHRRLADAALHTLALWHFWHSRQKGYIADQKGFARNRIRSSGKTCNRHAEAAAANLILASAPVPRHHTQVNGALVPCTSQVSRDRDGWAKSHTDIGPAETQTGSHRASGFAPHDSSSSVFGSPMPSS